MFVYILRAGNHGAIKIGVARNIQKRIACLQTGNAFELNLLASIPCSNLEQALTLEKRFHKFFSSQRIRGEWFQGNINFRKLDPCGFTDVDTTKSSLTRVKSGYVPVRGAKKKRRAQKLKKRG